MASDRRFGARPLADIASKVMDPVLRRKAGMTADLLAAWPEIAGLRLGDASRPIKLAWPPARGNPGEENAFEPATLIVACEGPAALRLQHQAGELVSRVNRFYGYAAVARLKIVQGTVREAPINRRVSIRALSATDRESIEAMTGHIEDEGLRETLKAFAEATLSRKRRDGD
ncbi:MAG: DUF721 domain-containing protein [Fulvimarina manganoxydans]|uniref:DUF721 domain-containing protein n=1 Tax=Fulvimarina manganoxydans TaxID=937218 RepID=UPI002354FE0B|nr:DciA family protein [Fulvimarina manganoxydans]MCK5931181.1 DUF721 domain-containing protein [Fulvimarina manganoxydans]